MKRILFPSILATIIVAFMVTSGQTSNAKETSFKASITCGGCKSKIEKSFKDTDGIYETSVDVASKTVSFKYDESKYDESTLKSKVKDLGYAVDVKEGSNEATATKTKADGKKCGTEKDCCKDKASKKDCGDK